MAALLGYQLLDILPPKAGLAHIICYSLYPFFLLPPVLLCFVVVEVEEGGG